MPKVEVTTDDVVESFCKMLEPGVRKDRLPPEDCNRYGIDVLYNKRTLGLIMFHFVTLDDLEVNLELDMLRLQAEGKPYLDHLYGLLCDQTEEARKVRQQENQITIYNTGSHAAKQAEANPPKLPELKPAITAHNKVFH